MSIRVLDPTLGPEAEEARMAPPLRALKGSTIGLLDNNKHNVARFLDHVEDILRSQYGVQDVVRRKKHDASRPAPREVLGELSACDAVISAVGDWGSCSSCSLHDALTAEKLGMPAAAVMTDRFVQTARVLAELNGLPEYPFAVIAHPIANNADAELRVKAEDALRQCLPILTDRRIAAGTKAMAEARWQARST